MMAARTCIDLDDVRLVVEQPLSTPAGGDGLIRHLGGLRRPPIVLLSGWRLRSVEGRVCHRAHDRGKDGLDVRDAPDIAHERHTVRGLDHDVADPAVRIWPVASRERAGGSD